MIPLILEVTSKSALKNVDLIWWLLAYYKMRRSSHFIWVTASSFPLFFVLMVVSPYTSIFICICTLVFMLQIRHPIFLLMCDVYLH